MSGYARGQFRVDWEDRFDVSRTEARPGAAGARSVGCLGDGWTPFWKDENVRYLTSLRAQLIAGKTTSLNGALLLPGQEPILLSSGGEVDKARFGMSWIGEVHAVPIMEQRELVDGFVEKILGGILKERGLTSGRLGVDQANLSFIESMRHHHPDLELVDGDTVMQQARWVKTDDEIVIIEEACAIGDSVTQRALDEARPGRRELEVAGDAMQTLFHLGGEMAHVITPYVASGEHMSPPHRLATDKIIRNGDLCFIDIGAMWNGYFADIGRTTSRRPAVKAPAAGVHRGLPGADGGPGDDATRPDQPGHGQRHHRQDRRARVGGSSLQPLHRARDRDRRQRAALYRRDPAWSDGLRVPAQHGVRRRTTWSGSQTSQAVAVCGSRTWSSSPKARRASYPGWSTRTGC